jgi:hypothetical protein
MAHTASLRFPILVFWNVLIPHAALDVRVHDELPTVLILGTLS